MGKSLQEAGAEFGVGHLRHHILFCRGPDCCATEQGEAVWKHLKKRLKSLGLSGAAGSVYRSKVDCLRICQNGPIMVVYPEGTWYARVDESKVDRIIDSHLLKGIPLVAEAFAIDRLEAKSSKNED